MSSITSFSFDDQLIREQDGLWSVYDLIEVIGGQKNPRKVWERLTVSFPEVVAKCHNLKFPGAGQRNTPVCDRQVALEIIGLLPGAVGKKYREEAAKLFLRYMDADVTVATEVVKRSTDEAAIAEHQKATEQHQKYLTTYHGIHGELHEHGCESIHHATYNKKANEAMGIEKGTRPKMSRKQELELWMYQAAGEHRLMDDTESQGWGAVNVAVKAGESVLKSLTGK